MPGDDIGVGWVDQYGRVYFQAVLYFVKGDGVLVPGF